MTYIQEFFKDFQVFEEKQAVKEKFAKLVKTACKQ